MLVSREAVISIKDITIRKKLTQGIPQGGILSPLLWNLVVETLLDEFDKDPVFIQAFADDLVLQISGHFPLSLVDCMNRAVAKAVGWGDGMGLEFNADKSYAIMFTKTRKPITEKVKLKDKPLEWQNSIKYLGITIDKKLTWNIHIENIYQKANIALARCKRAVSTTWGLTLKAAYWIYTAVIRPILSYGCLVWITVVEKKNLLKRLITIQRKALLTVTSARQTVSSATLEILTNTLPIELYLIKQAVKALYRISHYENLPVILPSNLNESLTKGHLGLLKRYTDRLETFQMPNDVILPVCIYTNSDKITWTDWDEDRSISAREVFCFTDGSRKDSSSGAGVFIKLGTQDQIKLKFPMGKYTTVFQAEASAIKEAVSFLLNMSPDDIKKYSKFIFISDSQSVLMALKQNITKTLTIKECWDRLEALIEFGAVELAWVKGHCGIPGNEQADSLAKEATVLPFSGPEPAVPISLSWLSAELSELIVSQHRQSWYEKNDNKHTKLLVSFSDSRRQLDCF